MIKNVDFKSAEFKLQFYAEHLEKANLLYNSFMTEWKAFRTLSRKIKWETPMSPYQEQVLSKPPLFHINRLKYAAAKVEFCQNKIKLYSGPLELPMKDHINNLCQKILSLYPDIF